ncbi:DUF6300 family protein [Streptomyces coeruleorubidus]|uniref:DUF6300 family protein n=1 Tax=Streptomyces coeruleorubidus TaxID=116188 RepID=UPI00237F84F6|nr:DUF6300 family protein [Streptomyces coeruleorubidus]WDV52751.1 DUF6300 family protein [Streptomyces coeruleorubidus]
MTPLVCARCAAPALLSARYPHTWHNTAGAPVEGLKETVLCGTCDADDPAAGRLPALLAEDGPPQPARLAGLITDWLTAVRHRTPDPTALAEEEARWRTGHL